MQVQNMTSARGNPVPNQFIISGVTKRLNFKGRNILIEGRAFQSYDSTIVLIAGWQHDHAVFLDEKFWNYSNTTGKYRNSFLQETKRETQAKIDSGEYVLTNLN